ncbi:pol [Symbiodinium sp. CCMP2456]|nr:pol [Symbiodinium sp. CCMP2456]
MNNVVEIGSPTEVVSDMEAVNEDDDGGGVGKTEPLSPVPMQEDGLQAGEMAAEVTRTRKRERDRLRRGDGRGEVKEEPDIESPTKRAHERHDDDEAPLSGKELRDLFAQHLLSVKQELHTAWGDVRGRLDRVEHEGGATKEQVALLSGRVLVNEKDNVVQQQELARQKNQIGDLETEVEGLKKQMAEIKVQPTRAGQQQQPLLLPGQRPDEAPDAWAYYLHQRRRGESAQPRQDQQGGQVGGEVRGRNFPGRGGDNDQSGLSEEDRRTLIIGGWLQDTKREVIESEAASLLASAELKPFLDSDKVIVFGPRKSFAVIKFKEREGEDFSHVKERLWGVIKYVNALKHKWLSASSPQQKPAWISFLKSKGSRQRTAHASMLPRIAIDLASDAKTEEGTPKCPDAILPESYDVDWAAGTTWKAQWKLGSSSHRQPRGDEIKAMPGGWVDIAALCQATGASTSEVVSTLERELSGRMSAKHVRLVSASWNLGGQPLEKVNNACPEGDLFFVQEVARRTPGWQTHGDDERCVWISFQHPDQWRGTAIGIASDIFDSVVECRSSKRGCAVVVRLRNFGRIVLASIHAPTGVSNDIYSAALEEAGKMFGDKWRHLPCILGIDVNEEIQWREDGEASMGADVCVGNANFQAMTDSLLHHGLRTVWSPDSRPRWLCRELPHDEVLVDWDDVRKLAKSHTKPRASDKYKDDQPTVEAFRTAKDTMQPEDWKRAHKLRRQARRQWCASRRERILRGDWFAYRDHKRDKNRTPGWWGRLLEQKTSKEITEDVQKHLEEKLKGPPPAEWDERLRGFLGELPDDGGWQPFSWEDIGAALSEMRANSSVSEDGIGVDLLRHVHQHDQLGNQLVDLINDTVKAQSADLIGSITRLRDTTREWKLPTVCAKLDVKGAFDRVRRDAAARLLIDRTRNFVLNAEVRWLVRQLGTNFLDGSVPGGARIQVECTQGIKQGAPESAELFGLLMGCQIDSLLDSPQWARIPTPWGDVPLCLLFYQDDVFIWDENIDSLKQRIELVAQVLGELGLELAEEKTQIIASPHYAGNRSIWVGNQRVNVLPPEDTIRVVGVNFSFHDSPGNQAKDLLARARAAAAYHCDLLGEKCKLG